ncbi:MAG TPA: NAD-dependent epimerase/dehydratase family protein, partial [Acidimicrobiales bacterium]|nr:NAD-dependent epimerase/dehydratase family protein [Acidimicrobiales bacterium]
MRVVVTGATGNLGTALLRRLAGRGDVEVVAVARRRPEGELAANVRFVAADVAADDLEPVFGGADALVHLAWLFQPTHRPDLTWEANVGGTARVLQAAARARVRTVVYSSSVGTYSPGRRTVDE